MEIKTETNFVEFYLNYGREFYARGDIGNAIVCFERAIEIKPDTLEANANLFITLKEVGIPDVEIGSYKRILNKNPDIASIGPLRIRIETSSACNLRCQHCPTGTFYDGADRGIMEMELFKKYFFRLRK